MVFANGAKADFRGSNDGYFSMVTFPQLAVNFRTQQALYRYGKAVVNGTFITEVFIRGITRSGKKIDWRHSSLKANEANWDWRMVNGTCGTKPFWVLIHRSYGCDDFQVKVDLSTSEVSFRRWVVRVTTNHVYNWISGARKRIDVTISGPQTEYSHGIIGQSFNVRYYNVTRNGRQDVYPRSGNFTTAAQAEGAIQGSHLDYMLRGPFQTDFVHSTFDAKAATVEPQRPALTSHVVDLAND